MYLKLLLPALAVVLQLATVHCQRQWIPPTTTAAEMWNPYTWYWPYAIAASESYRQYFQNAQQIQNQLYLQAYNTNAFWWTNRPPYGGGGGGGGSGGGGAGGGGGGAGGGGGGAPVSSAGGGTGQATGQATGQTGQATGQGGQPVPNMSQGGSGWN